MVSRDPFVGRDLVNGQFRIEKKIGTGGMGSVYMAKEIATGHGVAMKILHPKLASRNDLTERFRREARAMSHLKHPNTAKIFTYGALDEDGSLYIVMELLEGQNLNQALRKEGPMPLQRAIPIMTEVCGALEEAHVAGIVHRDLKPENIFLCHQGGRTDFPKVLDFGLAKVTDDQMAPGAPVLTQEGMVFGTPEFMSPEQAQGKTLDPRSDIYSLAVILYEMITGKLPFSAAAPMEYIQKHVLEPIIPLRDRVPGKQFPRGLGQVLAIAMSKKPDERYQTAAEFGEALRPFAGPDAATAPAPRPSLPKNSAGPAPVAAGPARAVAPAPMRLPEPPRTPVKKGLGVGALFLIAIGFLGVGAALALLILHGLSR